MPGMFQECRQFGNHVFGGRAGPLTADTATAQTSSSLSSKLATRAAYTAFSLTKALSAAQLRANTRFRMS